MSFGGSGGFGGFGSNNNQQSSGFGGGGGFGSSNTGFGSNNNTSAFGQSNTGGNPFGGGGNTSSPFGGGGGFGTNNNTTFGSKPFGATSGGGLFGGGASTSGNTFGGGFGSNTNTTASSGFGGGSTGGGLFGQNKTGFGASTGTGTGGMFGGGSTGTTGGFGTTNTTGGFGSSTTGGFGGAAQTPANNGTASTPFSAFQEKDGASSTQHFQTITFQQPYQNYSLDELRVVDYNQGRRYGNQNGQAGAFGQSTGFGGFGASNTNTSTGFGASSNTGGGLFGGGSNTGTGFGQSNTAGFGSNTAGFGSNTNTGGGMFGQNKPATGGLFGSTPTTQATGGGLFGASTTNTSTGFGSGFGSNATPAVGSSGGGLFGQQSQTQNKPFGSAFGASTTNTTSNPFGGGGGTSTGFGGQSTGGGLFGQQNQASSTPGFGSAQQTNTGSGLFGGGGGGGAFGQAQQNQTQAQPSGGLFGGGFGQNAQTQQKPGLFGASTTPANTGGGLFGNSAPAQQSGGLFGNTQNQNQNQGGGLFGAKPATTGGGLFGNTGGNAQNSTGGGMFGGLGTQNTQQNTGGGLFGAQQNQPKPTGGLFGNSTANTNTGGSLFGGGLGQSSNTGNLGGSLFGGQSQQQTQQPAMNNSMFNASGSSLLQTSMNTNPYGNDALFAGLATPQASPGPLATPLSSSQKNRKSAILPQHKLNPSASTRLLTPQGRKLGGNGYGFTYSTYGTPSSASSNSSPGHSTSLFSSGSLSRSLGKSLSTSNLRNSYTPETSILAPGAFSTTSRPYAGGSLKKLNINRSINTRVPLFAPHEPAPQPPKRVSFAGPANGDAADGIPNGPTNGAATNGATGSEIVLSRRDADENDSPPSSSTTTMNGDGPNGSSGRQEMQQVNGKELTPVPENGALTSRSSSSLNVQDVPQADPASGAYWSKPSLDQLRKMSRSELQRVQNFIVGRENFGVIQFNPNGTVDLTGVNLDKIFGDIVQITLRNAGVYIESTSVPKAPEGTGLNVPSRVTLMNSWPRRKKNAKAESGLSYQKHIERLRRVQGSTFEQYKTKTGEWIFAVPHFSGYGFDYDDDEESSELSAAPDTPAHPHNSSQMSSTPQEGSTVSPDQSSPDDTFDFQRRRRTRASLPGEFDDTFDEDEDVEMETQEESFLGERSVGSLDGQHDADYSEESESELVDEQNTARSVSGPVHTTEQRGAKDLDPFKDSLKLKSILKVTHPLKPAGTPSKSQVIFDDDWANQLQRTISPRKRDRQALRETQAEVFREDNIPKLSQSFGGQVISNGIDLMESLFGNTERNKALGSKRVGNGIEFPYPKRPKTSNDLDDMNENDRAFHSCNKPHFSETGTLIYSSKGTNNLEDGLFLAVQEPISGAGKDIRFTQLPTFPDANSPTLSILKDRTRITEVEGVPFATIRTDEPYLDFSDMAKAVSVDSSAGIHEQQVWQLLSLLFDETDEVPNDMTHELFEQHKERFRKDKLSEFWENLVSGDADRHVQQSKIPEEKAIAFLSGHNIPEACQSLLDGYDYHLATLIAQIGGDQVIRQDLAAQIEEWRRMNSLSEMEEPIRALYELASGNCAQSEGVAGGFGAKENKASSFAIAEQFGLDWRRAFGLRLWYGTLVDEPIEMAVAQFADALRDGREFVKPVPWFVEQEEDMGWDDPQAEDREDLLWGILKLYASTKMEVPANIEEVLAPENVSGNPLNTRLSFQLFQLFKSRLDDDKELIERKVGMPTVRGEGGARPSFLSSTASTSEKEGQSADPLIELGDKLTITYASSLHTQQHWMMALFVYTHLSSAHMREHHIRSLLAQFASRYAVDELDATYKYLTEELCIPVSWIHAAAALQAKTQGDDVSQTTHLIKAGNLEEAHEVLCRRVGPDSIVSRDYDALRELLGEFVPTPTNSPVDKTPFRRSTRGRPVQHPKEPVPGWSKGGQIYFDYVHLLDLASHISSYRIDEDLNKEVQALLSKLQHALELVARDRFDGRALEERVALSEIAKVVADMVAKYKYPDRSRVLKLPLTEDLWLRHSLDLSVGYYHAVIASGK
ncbi:hypothetical protein P154DRAFT_519829 [Amniculicola lignicola CBS 123094]|uniref:Peptidase S59 domain-containing protein n=1 Tax=Amniculicola lignicola CBS 123094 TaxID=1392246 RepID=A0A6A5WRL7_9PLEO|nr:hypothetical protein P154DRAFT_519829 [Amniculicola lignicola CBS 123094]